MEITLEPTLKQHQAWQILNDHTTTDFLFGGGAGGGKSWLGAEWLTTMCLQYPDTRYFIARETLKNLKKTTLRTLFKVFRHHGLKPGVHYKYNEQASVVTFIETGSFIDLLEVKHRPGDPDYEDLGSSEYTSGWIEEAGEVNFGAYDTLKTRIGRQNNDKYNILGKLYITCNPKKNWMYTSFYKPWKEKVLPPTSKFLQSLVDDNPKNESAYKDKLLNIKDKIKKQRLLYGKWEYDDTPGALMDYDNITDLWTNAVEESLEKYLVIDAARFGGDKIVTKLFKGMKLTKVWVRRRQSTEVTENEIKEIARVEQVPYSHIVVDEDGIGGGIVDHIAGVKGFLNNSTPLPDKRAKPNLEPPNYQNLKTQCYYILADEVNNHRMAIQLESFNSNDEEITEETFKDELIEELSAVRKKDVDSDDQKQRIVPKDETKEEIGRSPDWSDTMMMRMYFFLDKRGDKKPVKQYRPNYSNSLYGGSTPRPTSPVRPTYGRP